MDLKTRAELVRQARYELKVRKLGDISGLSPTDARDQYLLNPPTGGSRYTSRQRTEVNRTRSRFQRVRRGESDVGYVDRTAEGGDSSFAEAARRYDLRRPRNTRSARNWPGDGYAHGYNRYGASFNPGGVIRPPRPQRGRAPAYPGRNR